MQSYKKAAGGTGGRSRKSSPSHQMSKGRGASPSEEKEMSNLRSSVSFQTTHPLKPKPFINQSVSLPTTHERRLEIAKKYFGGIVPLGLDSWGPLGTCTVINHFGSNDSSIAKSENGLKKHMEELIALREWPLEGPSLGEPARFDLGKAVELISSLQQTLFADGSTPEYLSLDELQRAESEVQKLTELLAPRLVFAKRGGASGGEGDCAVHGYSYSFSKKRLEERAVTSLRDRVDAVKGQLGAMGAKFEAGGLAGMGVAGADAESPEVGLPGVPEAAGVPRSFKPLEIVGERRLSVEGDEWDETDADRRLSAGAFESLPLDLFAPLEFDGAFARRNPKAPPAPLGKGVRGTRDALEESPFRAGRDISGRAVIVFLDETMNPHLLYVESGGAQRVASADETGAPLRHAKDPAGLIEVVGSAGGTVRRVAVCGDPLAFEVGRDPHNQPIIVEKDSRGVLLVIGRDARGLPFILDSDSTGRPLSTSRTDEGLMEVVGRNGAGRAFSVGTYEEGSPFRAAKDADGKPVLICKGSAGQMTILTRDERNAPCLLEHDAAGRDFKLLEGEDGDDGREPMLVGRDETGRMYTAATVAPRRAIPQDTAAPFVLGTGSQGETLVVERRPEGGLVVFSRGPQGQTRRMTRDAQGNPLRLLPSEPGVLLLVGGDDDLDEEGQQRVYGQVTEPTPDGSGGLLGGGGGDIEVLASDPHGRPVMVQVRTDQDGKKRVRVVGRDREGAPTIIDRDRRGLPLRFENGTVLGADTSGATYEVARADAVSSALRGADGIELPFAPGRDRDGRSIVVERSAQGRFTIATFDGQVVRVDTSDASGGPFRLLAGGSEQPLL
eukprot:Cvel_29955.t1-p1 / transcript=Cvel_29955.t1 / gene=Cvel_29955 / organism=Chromera_velia_CCMP2878 / gene_product=hypothetical protein / transcript_product=hypothetical protein / location=Cvel_scaffold4195:21-4532(-) / protein_length=838 / sequence_SO=supercontig / SO=protein_coding / is_pseudo=false